MKVIRRKKKKKQVSPASSDEWWREAYQPQQQRKKRLLSPLKLPSLNLSSLKSWLKPSRYPSFPRRAPRIPRIRATVALILLVTYIIVTINSVQFYPTIVLLTFPTMWILIDYIRELTKRRGEEE